jgi:hypothetical protein
VVHFLNKGGGYLGEALHRKERGREWPVLRITDDGDFLRERRSRRERTRKKEGPVEPI